MISKLDNSKDAIARQIYRVFQSSYRIEAQLIGTLNFPPLARTTKDIAWSDTLFYGFFEHTSLAAVIEITVSDTHLDIDSLTVAPDYFRRGIADKLINYVLGAFDYTTATVETAVVNEPAIRLYKKHGFVECKRWTPSHGIEKVAFSRDKAF